MEITNEALRAIAQRFLETRLWEKLTAEEVFALEFFDGSLGYCFVEALPEGGAALTAFPGVSGLERAMEALSGEAVRDGLRCEFRPEAPEPRFLRVPRSGGSAEVESPEDRQRLADALAAGLAMSTLLERRDKAGLGLRPLGSAPEALPLLTCRDGVLRLQSFPISAPAEDWPAPCLDETTAARLRRLPREGVLELELFPYPRNVVETGAAEGAGFHPVLLLSAWQGEDFDPNIPAFRDEPEQAGALLEALAELLLARMRRPETLLVRQRRAEALAADLCARADIRLAGAAELPMVEAVETELLAELQEEEAAPDPEAQSLLERQRLLRELQGGFDFPMEMF